MLKNRIFNIIKNKEDAISLSIKGNLKVFGFDKNKKLIHIDEGQNTVTTWTKQMIVKTFAGVPYLDGNTTDGSVAAGYINFPVLTAHVADTTNSEGSVLSNQGYFDEITQSALKGNGGTVWDDGYVPTFPTKMLFGTGIELYKNSGTWTYAYSEGGVTGNKLFTTNDHTKLISYESDGNDLNVQSETYGTSNLYSNIYGSPITKPIQSARTVDTVDATLVGNIKPTFSATSYGISGAVKNNNYITAATVNTIFPTTPPTTNSDYVVTPNYRGVGNPAFIYVDRTSVDAGSSSYTYINKSTGYVSNRITYKITMPDQAAANYYYPYNGYYLREAGLFTDARYYEDTGNGSNVLYTAGNQDGLDTYHKMLFGILCAKRRIATIYKSFDNSYTFEWTLYIE